MDDESPSPRLLVSQSDWHLLEVQLLTGRKHQIRVQLSHAGLPIVGDRKYGSTRPFTAGIALHTRRLVIEHPVSKMQLEIEAPLPASWQRFLRELMLVHKLHGGNCLRYLLGDLRRAVYDFKRAFTVHRGKR